MTPPSRMLERGRNFPSWAAHGPSRWIVWRRRAATGVASLLVAVMGYGVVFGHNGITAFRDKRAEEQRLRDQMGQLERENARLRDRVQRLGNDPGAVEHQAREDLHYTRPGEVIYTLAPDGKAPPPQQVR